MHTSTGSAHFAGGYVRVDTPTPVLELRTYLRRGDCYRRTDGRKRKMGLLAAGDCTLGALGGAATRIPGIIIEDPITRTFLSSGILIVYLVYYTEY